MIRGEEMKDTRFEKLGFMFYEKPDKDIDYTIGYTYGIISAFLGTLFTILNGKYLSLIHI